MDLPFPPTATASLVGVVIGGGLAGLNGMLGQWRQGHLERAKYARSLNDARIARLRVAYAVLIEMADTYVGVAHELMFVTKADGSAEKRDERLNEALQKASSKLSDALIALRLDQESSEELRLIEELRKAFGSYMIDYGESKEGGGKAGAFQAGRELLRAKANELETLIRRRLADLEKPI
jgi:hypothetical protein